MSEKLIVDNFAGIKHIELDVGKINILIGPHATGKSVCAKLLYLLKNFHWDLFNSAMQQHAIGAFDAIIKRKFKKFFPVKSWRGTKFQIKYEVFDFFIQIRNESDLNSKIQLNYSEWYRDEFKNKRSEMNPHRRNEVELQNMIKKDLWGWLWEFGYPIGFEQLFVPAERSCFSLVEENIYTMISKEQNIDPFLSEFGRIYNIAKRMISDLDIEKPSKKKILNENEHLLRAKYLKKDNKDYLVHSGDRLVELLFSSSGQKELLPLIKMLEYLYLINVINRPGNSIYIEEPESHIFPETQKKIVELMSTVYNNAEGKLQFFITTHSPYILTAFNNLMYAGLIEKTADEEKKKELYNIISKEKIINPDDVHAYSLQDGKCENIKDPETGLIDANVLDEVSNKTGREFDRLLDLE